MVKKLRDRNNEYLNMRIKMFNTVGTGTLMISVIAIIIAIASGFDLYTWVTSTICSVLILALMLSVTMTKKYEIGTTFLSLTINLILFPSLFFTSGGISGAVPMFFLIGILFSMIVLDGIVVVLITFIEVLFYIFLFYLSIHYPNIIPVIDSSIVRLANLAAGLIISSIIAGYIFRILIKQNNKERLRIDNLLKKDPLTKVYNRRYLMDALTYYIENKDSYPLSIAMFDIDNFKSVNDQYGHVEGDNVLINFGHILLGFSDDLIFPSRYGGEEFIVVMPNTSLDNSLTLANKIRGVVEERCGISRRVTCSGGVATYKDGQTVEQFINEADVKLYYAKTHGKNQIAK